MVRKVSAMAVRDRLGQLLEEVYYQGDTVIIERAGRPMAVLVSPAEYERLRAEDLLNGLRAEAPPLWRWLPSG